MRTALLACAIAILAAPAASRAQRLADSVPLRPGAPTLRIVPWDRCPPTPESVADCTGRWIPYRSVLVSTNGRDRAASWGEAERLLVGEIGTVATLRYRAADGIHEVALPRSDVYAPGPGFTELMLTPHFALHHRPADARRARSIAAEAEGAYSSSGLPRATGGRRAHLWVMRDYVPEKPGRPYPQGWGARATGRYDPILEYGELFTYVAYGIPGAAGQRLDGGGWADANTLHRHAVAELLGNTAWLDRSWTNLGRAASLREYIRERYGLARLEQIWRADTSLDVAIPRTLGISRAQVEADWRRHLFALGPNPAAGPTTGAVGVTLAWAALLLIAGAVVARKREVD
jgi:hypothetical protein